MDVEKAKTEIRAAFENRAAMYYYIFEELRGELGQERAAGIMRRAIYARGVQHGKQKYGQAAADSDFAAIAEMFCSGSACEGELFEPSTVEVRQDGVVLKMTACPLVDAWRKLGLSDEDVDLMCEIAAAVDEGTYEGIGLGFRFQERLAQPAGSACILDIREK